MPSGATVGRPVGEDLTETDLDLVESSEDLSLPVGAIVNPISVVRQSYDLSLRQFARNAQTNYQTLYLTEKGCFTKIPASILGYCVLELDRSRFVLETSYTEFQRSQREAVGKHLGLELLGTEALGWSFAEFRENLGFSRIGFCKALCLPPAVVTKLETSRQRNLPIVVSVALQQAGLAVELIGELEERLSGA